MEGETKYFQKSQQGEVGDETSENGWQKDEFPAKHVQQSGNRIETEEEDEEDNEEDKDKTISELHFEIQSLKAHVFRLHRKRTTRKKSRPKFNKVKKKNKVLIRFTFYESLHLLIRRTGRTFRCGFGR
jgi:hypothetical protein